MQNDPPVQASPASPVAATKSSTGLDDNVASLLAYLFQFLGGLIFFLIEKDSRFVRFHAMQSILFCAAAIVFSIAWSIVWGILFSISGSLIFIDVPLRLVISLGLFLFWLFVMYQAYSHREYRIPVIGAIAAKQVG